MAAKVLHVLLVPTSLDGLVARLQRERDGTLLLCRMIGGEDDLYRALAIFGADARRRAGGEAASVVFPHPPEARAPLGLFEQRVRLAVTEEPLGDDVHAAPAVDLDE